MKRAICLIVDGLGIGAMDDVSRVTPEDQGANTLAHIAQTAGPLNLPILKDLGLGNLCEVNGVDPVGSAACASYGKLCLKHFGADTYMGHQELMGTIPAKPIRQLMNEVAPRIVESLKKHKYVVRNMNRKNSILIVEDKAVIADNIEAQAGMNINVTGSLDEIDFESLCKIGEIVRNVVDVSRVIIVASRGFDIRDIKCNIEERNSGQIGVNSPKLGVYNNFYQVRHLGKGIEFNRQVQNIAIKSNIPVALIGKAADVIHCMSPFLLDSVINTEGVFQVIMETLESVDIGLIVANVQESDLAGHEQDPVRWRKVLEAVERGLKELLINLQPQDLLVITGDHGNDPTIGHSQHTRELTPLLLYAQRHKGVDIGTRLTLADVGATLSDYLSLLPTQDGTSVLSGGK
jgi:phosphopentomutase